jgi:hypothetical protein
MSHSEHWPQGAAVAAAELLCAPCCALATLVGARVAVETVGGGAAREGLLHSVDPETRSLVLLEVRHSVLQAREVFARHAAAPDGGAARFVFRMQGCVSAAAADELHAPTVSVVLAHALVRLTGARRQRKAVARFERVLSG